MMKPTRPALSLSLSELRERARSPEAEKADLDALLIALRRPVWPGENRAQRAEVLCLILEDPWLGGFTGSDGHRVDRAAAYALAALGEPYASKLSAQDREALLNAPASQEPEALEEKEEEEEVASVERAPEQEAPEKPWPRRLIVLGLILGAGFEFFSLSQQSEDWVHALLLPFSASTAGFPALLLLWKPGPRNRLLYRLSAVLAGLSLLPVVLSCTTFLLLFMGTHVFTWALGMGALRVALIVTFLQAERPRAGR